MVIKVIWSEMEVLVKTVPISPRDVLVSLPLLLSPSHGMSLKFWSQPGEYGLIRHLVSCGTCRVPVVSCSSCLGVLCCC